VDAYVQLETLLPSSKSYEEVVFGFNLLGDGFSMVV
jgi:hypothetical protein